MKEFSTPVFLPVVYIVILFGLLHLFSCKPKSKTKIYPYSMLEYKNDYFIDKTEITVEQWAEFVFDGNEAYKPSKEIVKKFSYYPLFYPETTPDSLYKAFGKIEYYKLPVIKTYFDTLNYTELRNILDYPITGISFEDVKAYCAWRTSKYRKVHPNKNKKIVFTLPDSVVFDHIKPLFVENKNSRKIPIANVKESKYIRKKDAPNSLVYHQVGQMPVKVSSFKAKGDEIFDLWGNVAEMTRTKGISYGGSYHHDSLTIQQIHYTKPEPWLGFRCVAIEY